MEQKRFILAIILSAAILFAWQYFFSPVPEKSNNATSAVEKNAQSPEPATSNISSQTQSIAPTPPLGTETLMQRTVVVDTPLYKVTFDNRGAVPTSWIIKKIKDNERDKEIFSVGAVISQRQPLELISPRGLEISPRETSLRLITGDTSLDTLLNERIYNLGTPDAGSNEVILHQGDRQELTFFMRDEASGVEAVKRFEFSADDYSVKLETKVSRNDQALPSAELSIGPSIGDQGVPHYTFYSVAPEAVVATDNDVTRHTAVTINDQKNFPGSLTIKQSVQWASIADTYFAMVALPTQPFSQARFQTTKYEYEHNGQKENRFLINCFVPVPASGLSTYLYVGPKDHYLLTAASNKLTAALNRPPDSAIDLDGLIDYGFLSTISRPIAIPILYAIKNLSALTGNYGLAIILFTIIIYSLFFPLKWRSSKAMKKAQKFAPRMKEVGEKIKTLKPNDPRLKELQMEQLRLMKEGNMLGGCLPLLIQMPFFFALYRAITISLDFRQASFLWLPDLSAADSLHLLPVLMAGSILTVQLITPAPTADPLQRKMMAFVVPAVMLYALWSAPAGLLLYWLVGNIVTFSQQMLINRLIRTDDVPSQTDATRQVIATG